MPFQNSIITEPLLDRVIDGDRHRMTGIHGLEHWLRVERNGLYLSDSSGADTSVVSLFALFHDARRENDNWDPGHGARGAQLAEEFFREGLIPIDQNRFELLIYACQNHTDVTHSDDATAGTCWDADRLDLPRRGVWITPASDKLNTPMAKKLADSQSFDRLEGFIYPAFGASQAR